jgi:hypothetical protein
VPIDPGSGSACPKWLTFAQRNGPLCSDRAQHFHNQFQVILAAIALASRGFFDAASADLRRSIAPVSPQPPRFGRRRIRDDRADVHCAAVRDPRESAMVFFASQVLETVTQDSARMIMTGQEQTNAKTQADFKSDLCKKVNALFDCLNGITVDVESFPQFSTVTLPDPIDANGNYTPPSKYLPGGPGDIVVVRAFYQWPIFVTGLGFNLSDVNGKRILTATAAFQNEPY